MASPNEEVIAWRPDFNLDGSVSSRSSPSANSWTELVGPLESNTELVDPLDSGYVPQFHGPLGEYSMNQFTPVYPSGLIFASANPQSVPASFVSGPKHEDTFAGAGYGSVAPTGTTESYTSYYEPHGSLHSATVSADFMHNQSETQYVFHDIDPTTNYLDGSVYAGGAPPDYVW